MSYRSSWDTVGGAEGLPDYVYYNADIINNQATDLTTGLAAPDPPIRFNETRDTALIKDASQYHFSIVRFQMDGPNRNLPLFIPTIKVGPSQNFLGAQDVTVYSVALSYQQTWNVAPGTGPGGGNTASFAITPAPTFVTYESENLNPIIAPLPALPLTKQDISSQYYWVKTYQHWLDLCNAALLTQHQLLYTTFQTQWNTLFAASLALNPFPFASFDAFVANANTPQITFNPNSKLMSIWGDSDGFGPRLEPFAPVAYGPTTAFNIATVYAIGQQVVSAGIGYQSLVNGNVGNVPAASPAQWVVVPFVAGPNTKPTLRLFFNTNMYGLFNNFNANYYNSTSIAGFPSAVPEGYVYEILFSNNFYQNVVDYRLAPYTGVPPLGYVPISQAKVYYQMTQDYKSIDSLWSPISAIVFTTTLLPVRNEAVGAPVAFGRGNLGISSSSQSAFQPIITDVSINLSAVGADDYRSFTFYSPIAEYRMSDLTASRTDIRNIDIQVFWKNRLTGDLNPITMPNQSTVSFKLMFRKKGVA